MSKQYDLYLEQHKQNVAKGFYWIMFNLPELLNYTSMKDSENQICDLHDLSKLDKDEYLAYDAYFYGGNRTYKVVQNFRYAWLNHIHKNPHHWQYWVLNNDEPDEGEIVLDMPYNYIIEMICDWWSFSWSSGNLFEIFDWFNEHKKYIKLSYKTSIEVESILGKINKKLKETEKK